jgi:predicted transcriptional regulator
MEVHFTPDIQTKLEEMARESGRPADKLVQDAVAGFVDDLAGTREMLNSRYDDIKSGKVKLIPGEEIEAYFRERSADARRSQPGS